MESIFKKKIVVGARAGGELTRCITESIVLAMNEGVLVILVHNDREYKVNPSQISSCVTEIKEEAQ